MHIVFVDETAVGSYRYLEPAKDLRVRLLAFYPAASVFILPGKDRVAHSRAT
jgi:hypothetical protein